MQMVDLHIHVFSLLGEMRGKEWLIEYSVKDHGPNLNQ